MPSTTTLLHPPSSSTAPVRLPISGRTSTFAPHLRSAAAAATELGIPGRTAAWLRRGSWAMFIQGERRLGCDGRAGRIWGRLGEGGSCDGWANGGGAHPVGRLERRRPTDLKIKILVSLFCLGVHIPALVCEEEKGRAAESSFLSPGDCCCQL
ncbi:unnamed protein product [Linum trigynum]|uniref:Uncharacterized protein n=1 Tax=Linum trigynum TaxID=586398 RepID=A0AAV2F6W5_9ROSI